MSRKGPTIVVLFAAVLFFFPAGPVGADAPSGCLTCHQDQGDEPSKLYPSDIHSAKGITCAGCHGGDPSSDDMDTAMDPKKGFIGAPARTDISHVCLSCHANAARMASFHSSIDVRPFQLFEKSVHAEPDIATCVTCHEVHKIASHSDPRSPVYPTREVETCARCHSDPKYMRKYQPGLPTDQLEKYQTSVHGQRLQQGDIKVATCSACHGAHDIFSPKDPASHVYHLNVPQTCARCHSDARYMKGYRIPTDQYQKYSVSVHAVALFKKHDMGAPACNDCHGNHGAVPPGVESIEHVCGSCHPFNMEYFTASPHAAAFQKRGLAPCVVCHGNHRIEHPVDGLLDPRNTASVCEHCHKPGDPGSKAGREMYESLTRLEAAEAAADKDLTAAEQKGMDVSDARFEYKDIQETLIKAQTSTHRASAAEVKKIVDSGLTLAAKTKKAGEAALKEYSFRRSGLAISTLFITLLVVALYLKIRSIEK